MYKCITTQVDYAYVFSPTKLEIRAEQVLPRREGRRGGWGR
jgi:hypothetical protein